MLGYETSNAETSKQGLNQMTYAETKEIMDTIESLKTFSQAIGREKQESDWDWERIERLEKYVSEAEQKLFVLCTK
jgi:ABC-type transporter Mla subunit MlaD